MRTRSELTCLPDIGGNMASNIAISDDVALTDLKKGSVSRMYLAAVASLFSAMAAGFISGYTAPATYDMTTDPQSPVSPTQDDVTWIGSVISFGVMAGSACGGPLADQIGRKDTIVYNVIPLMVGWLSISFATGVTAIIIGRVFSGFACGLTMVVVPLYCVEISTPEVRGLLGSAAQGFLVIGNLLVVLIGYYASWQNLALVGAFISAFAFFCFLPMPESPRFLLARGKLTRAIEVMEKLQGDKQSAVEECTAIHKDLQNERKGRLSLKELKQPTVYRPALIVMGVMFFQQFSGTMAIFSYSSYIFDAAKSFLDPKVSTIIIGAVQVMVTVPSNFIVDRAGRKVMLMISGGIETLSLFALGTYYYMSSTSKDFRDSYGWIPLLSITLFVVAYSIGYGPIPGFLAAEMVPTRARSTISGGAVFMMGVYLFAVTKSFSLLEDTIGSHGTFWLYGIVALIGIFYVFFIVPETKGKKLEEISNLFVKTDNTEATAETL